MNPIVVGYLAPIAAGHELLVFRHAEWTPDIVGYVLHTDPIIFDLTASVLYGGRHLPGGLTPDNVFEELPLVDPQRARLVDDVGGRGTLVHRKHYRAEAPRRATVVGAVVRSEGGAPPLVRTELYVEYAPE